MGHKIQFLPETHFLRGGGKGKDASSIHKREWKALNVRRLIVNTTNLQYIIRSSGYLFTGKGTKTREDTNERENAHSRARKKYLTDTC